MGEKENENEEEESERGELRNVNLVISEAERDQRVALMSQLSEAPTIEFGEDDQQKDEEKYELRHSLDDDECTICLTNFKRGQLIAILSCGHTSHQCCLLVATLNGIDSCPLCRSPLVQVQEEEMESVTL